jgi:hypothetical protein
MIKISRVLVAISDGTPDKTGDAFMQGCFHAHNPMVSLVVDGPNGDTVVGEAMLQITSGSVIADLALSDLAISHQVAMQLYPAVGGSLIRRSGHRIERAEVRRVHLHTSPNVDQRILRLVDQNAKVLQKQADGTWQEILYKRPYVKPAPVLRPRCRSCSGELSATLDAYYGKNPAGNLHCGPCRHKLGIA